MFFETECDERYVLSDLYRKYRCNKIYRRNKSGYIAWSWPREPFLRCFYDDEGLEQGQIITLENNKLEFKKLHKLYLRSLNRKNSPMPMKFGFTLNKELIAIISQQASFCNVYFRYFDEYDVDMVKDITITVSDLSSKIPFIFDFGIEYCVLKNNQ